MAVPIPNSPTDNLYKFVALSGIFMVVVPTIFLNSELRHMNTKAGEILAIQHQATSNAEALQVFGDKDSKNDYEQLIKIFELSKDARVETAALKARAKWVKSFHVWNLIITITGVFMAFWGFINWFKRVQKPLDKILQLNLEKSRLEASLLKESQPPL